MTQELITIGLLSIAVLAFLWYVAYIGKESGKRARLLNEKHTEILDLKHALEAAKQAAERGRLDAAAAARAALATTNKEMVALQEQEQALRAALKTVPYLQAMKGLVDYAIRHQQMHGVFAVMDFEATLRGEADKYGLAQKRLELFRVFMEELIREGASEFVRETQAVQYEDLAEHKYVIRVRTPPISIRVVINPEDLWKRK